jgi:hypothetical protein
MNEKNNVPQWILESKTGIEEQNDEVGLIVAGFIGAFVKRGFDQKEIGMLMAQAFLLPLEEVEKRVDAILSCDENADAQTARNLCIYTVQSGALFDNDNSDPCDIIELVKTMYGGEFAFEAFLTYPELLRLWKKKAVRNSSQYQKEKQEADGLLDELERVYKS